MTRQRLADRLFSSSPHSCCAGGGREARVRAPLVPPAGRNLSGSAGARKPSVQDKAQAAERPCAALEGLPHLVPCRSWGPSAAPASASSPSVPTRLEVPLQRRAPHPQAEPHLGAAAACLEGRGGGQQARRARELLAAAAHLRFPVPMFPVLTKSDLLEPQEVDRILSWASDLELLRGDMPPAEGMGEVLSGELLQVLQTLALESQLVAVSSQEGEGMEDLYALVQSAFAGGDDLEAHVDAH